jgi:hypothetical protein
VVAVPCIGLMLELTQHSEHVTRTTLHYHYTLKSDATAAAAGQSCVIASCNLPHSSERHHYHTLRSPDPVAIGTAVSCAARHDSAVPCEADTLAWRCRPLMLASASAARHSASCTGLLLCVLMEVAMRALTRAPPNGTGRCRSPGGGSGLSDLTSQRT